MNIGELPVYTQGSGIWLNARTLLVVNKDSIDIYDHDEHMFGLLQCSLPIDQRKALQLIAALALVHTQPKKEIESIFSRARIKDNVDTESN